MKKFEKDIRKLSILAFLPFLSFLFQFRNNCLVCVCDIRILV